MAAPTSTRTSTSAEAKSQVLGLLEEVGPIEFASAIYESYVTPWFDYLLVSRDEMTDLLSGMGWQLREFIGSSDFKVLAVIEKVGGI